MKHTRKSMLVAAAVALIGATATTARAQDLFDGAGALRPSATGVGQPMTLTFTTPIIAVPSLTGIFSGIISGTTGTVRDITVGTGAYAIADFIRIANYTFSLTDVVPGSFGTADCSNHAVAAGQTCSPDGTPFNFTNLSNGHGGINTASAFNIAGIVTTPTAQQYSYTGIFTSQFTNISFQGLQEAIAKGRAVPVSYSVTLSATSPVVGVLATPEPASLMLMASGLIALAGVAWMRRA